MISFQRKTVYLKTKGTLGKTLSLSLFIILQILQSFGTKNDNQTKVCYWKIY